MIWRFQIRTLLDIIVASLVGAFWALHMYAWAFWFALILILQSLLSIARAIADPDGFFDRRTELGLDPSTGISDLIVVKAITIPVAAAVAWHLGERAGYY